MSSRTWQAAPQPPRRLEVPIAGLCWLGKNV